jgi:hypothetical protein
VLVVRISLVTIWYCWVIRIGWHRIGVRNIGTACRGMIQDTIILFNEISTPAPPISSYNPVSPIRFFLQIIVLTVYTSCTRNNSAAKAATAE